MNWWRDFCLLGFNAVWSVASYAGFLFGFFFFTPKMEATCSSKTLGDFQWTTWRYIPQERTLHNRCCRNLKSYKVIVICNYLSWYALSYAVRSEVLTEEKSTVFMDLTARSLIQRYRCFRETCCFTFTALSLCVNSLCESFLSLNINYVKLCFHTWLADEQV
jgi:uncharacterized metal-binding protein